MQDVHIRGIADDFPVAEFIRKKDGNKMPFANLMLLDSDLCLPCVFFDNLAIECIKKIKKDNVLDVYGTLFQKISINDDYSYDINTYLLVNSFSVDIIGCDYVFTHNGNYEGYISFVPEYPVNDYLKGRLISLERNVINAEH